MAIDVVTAEEADVLSIWRLIILSQFQKVAKVHTIIFKHCVMSAIKRKETHIIRTEEVLSFIYNGKALEKTWFCHPYQTRIKQTLISANRTKHKNIKLIRMDV